MAKKTYAEKLKDPRWQKKRLEVLSDAEFQCELCGDTESTLHVHHKQYIKGHDVWEYERQQLACLCESCHENQHDLDVRFQDCYQGFLLMALAVKMKFIIFWLDFLVWKSRWIIFMSKCYTSAVMMLQITGEHYDETPFISVLPKRLA